jgi:hypothetical protein
MSMLLPPDHALRPAADRSISIASLRRPQYGFIGFVILLIILLASAIYRK